MSKEWKHTTERFIAFLDIMGFKDMVARQDHEVIRKNLIDLTHLRKFMEGLMGMSFVSEENAIAEADNTYSSVRSLSFSDTVLFISSGNSNNDFNDVVHCSNVFLSAAIKSGIPAKGAISFGLLTADFDNQIFLGQPLIDAYLLQEELKYYGVIFHHSVDQTLLENSDHQVNLEDVKWLPTPMKTGIINHYNVVPSGFDEFDLSKLYKSVSGAPRIYVDNSIRQFKAFQK